MCTYLRDVLLPAPELIMGCFYSYTLVYDRIWKRYTVTDQRLLKHNYFAFSFQLNITRATALLLSNVCIRSSLSFLLPPVMKLLFQSASLHPKSLLQKSCWFSFTFTAFHIKVLWLSKSLKLVLKNESGNTQNLRKIFKTLLNWQLKLRFCWRHLKFTCLQDGNAYFILVELDRQDNFIL